MSVVIAYPFNATSAILGQRCLSNLYDVLLFMPNQVDEDFGEHILQDLQIIAAMSSQRTATKVTDPDFSSTDVKVVFFPSMGKIRYLFIDLH